MEVEKANSNKAIATSFPPHSPIIPCENAFAVNSAELTRDFPLNTTCSANFPFTTLTEPEYNSPSK